VGARSTPSVNLTVWFSSRWGKRRDGRVYDLRNVSKLSATLSPTASLTTGTSVTICPFTRFRLLAADPSSTLASSSSSPRSNAPVVVVGGCLRLGVDAFVELVPIGVGALLGGIEDLGKGGDDGVSMVRQEKRVGNAKVW
jgi:hypothetical protein